MPVRVWRAIRAANRIAFKPYRLGGGHARFPNDMVIGKRRFDTSMRGPGGSRWSSVMRSSAGYTVRHPPGL